MRPDFAWPKARAKDILIQESNQETFVYDKKSQQAHCLSELAGLVWRHCDGQRGWQELAVIAHDKLGVPNDSQVIEFVLNELALAKLLQTGAVITPEQNKYTRREVARRFGLNAGAGFLLAPLITLATASTAAEGTLTMALPAAVLPFAPQAKAA